jgi:hypothetical protein
MVKMTRRTTEIVTIAMYICMNVTVSENKRYCLHKQYSFSVAHSGIPWPTHAYTSTCLDDGVAATAINQ